MNVPRLPAVLAAAAALPLLLASAGCMMTRPAAVRPAAWAQPVELDGVPNLFRVSDRLYRSAQPTDAGMARLPALGIKTVVNLRAFHSDRDEVAGTGLDQVHLHVTAWHPERAEAVAFLRVMADPRRAPVLVHCQHGSDRTGAFCALYRMAVEGWTADEAVREMTAGGHGFHSVFDNLPEWIAGLDIPALRREAGLPALDSSSSPPQTARALKSPSASGVPVACGAGCGTGGSLVGGRPGA